MKPGTRVTVQGRSGVVKALRPGDSVDVQFDGDSFTSRHGSAHVKPLRENGRRSRNPGPRGGLTTSEREALPTSVFALPGRRFPINDANHGRIALQYILAGRVSEGDVDTVVQAVLRRWGRDPEVRAFYEKHKGKLTSSNVAHIHGRRYVSNPGDDVYDPAKEQFRSVVQGVYESQVRRELGLPSGTDFTDARGRRIDAPLDAATKKRLLSSAYAIATRQGQKHGWLIPGTQTPTERGLARSMERLSEQEHAGANRQDYERTLGAVRKSGHYRVVPEVVQGQTRYIVQPRPPANLVKIPEYRLNEAAAVEDAQKAEAALAKAPFDVKSRANPYYLRARGDQNAYVEETLDIENDPDHIILTADDTLKSAARRLGVPPLVLLRYGVVEEPVQTPQGYYYSAMPRTRLMQVEKQKSGKLYPEYVSPDPKSWTMEPTEGLDPLLAGHRIRKGPLVMLFEAEAGRGWERYWDKDKRKAAIPAVLSAAYARRAEAQQAEFARLEAAREAQIQAGSGFIPVDQMSLPQMQAELEFLTRRSDYERYRRARAIAEEAAGGITSKGAKRRIESTGDAAKEAEAALPPNLLDRVHALQSTIRSVEQVSRTQRTRPITAGRITPVIGGSATGGAAADLRAARLPENLRAALPLVRARSVLVSFGPKVIEARYFGHAYSPATGSDKLKAVEFLETLADRKTGKPDAVLGKSYAVFSAAEDAVNDLERRIDVMKRKNDLAMETFVKQYEALVSQIRRQSADDREAALTASSLLTPSASGSLGRAGEVTASPFMAMAATATRAEGLLSVAGEIAFELAQRECVQEAMKAKPDITVDEILEVRARCREELGAQIGRSPGVTQVATGYATDLRNLLLSDPEELERKYLSRVLRPPNFSSGVAERLLDLNAPKKTPKEERLRKRAGEERPTGAVWDIEFKEVDVRDIGPDGKPVLSTKDQVRYILYVPNTLRTITKVKRVDGLIQFSGMASRKYARFKQSKPQSGPLAAQSAPSEIYQKQDDEVTDAARDLNEARQQDDIKGQVVALNRISNARRTQRRYRDAIAGHLDPFLVDEYQKVPAAKKVALFNLLSRAPPASLAARFSVLGITQAELERAAEMRSEDKKKFKDANEEWVEDRSFRPEVGKQRGFSTYAGKTVSLDPRTGMVKFYTTNPLLAWYTILLWNTPELFTGTTIILPTKQMLFGKPMEMGDLFETVTVSGVDVDNPNNNPMKVYEELVAQDILRQGQFIRDIVEGKFEDAATTFVELNGVDVPGQGQARMDGLTGAIQKILKNMESVPSAKDVFGDWQYEKDIKAALASINDKQVSIQSDFEQGRITPTEYQQARIQLGQIARNLAQNKQRYKAANTALVGMMTSSVANAIVFGQEVNVAALEAWKLAARGVRSAINKRVPELGNDLATAQQSGASSQVIADLQADYNALMMLRQRFGGTR